MKNPKKIKSPKEKSVKKKPAYRLDIFGSLKKIGSRDLHFYRNLDDVSKKAFAPFVFVRWLSSIKDDRVILRINHGINRFTFDLRLYPELLWLMMVGTSPGLHQRYAYVSTKKKINSSKTVEFLMNYYGYSRKQATQSYPILPSEIIIKMCEEYGLQKLEISQIKKELKSRE